MKSLMFVFLFLVSSLVFAKDTYVNGYYRKNGTYVQPHYRSAPNSTKLDNYSTYGNTNPYTGKQGTINPYGSQNINNEPKTNDSWGNADNSFND